jgi:hypothetical protein
VAITLREKAFFRWRIVLVLFNCVDDTAVRRFRRAWAMGEFRTDLPAGPSPIMSGDMADVLLAGVLIEHDPDSAELWGEFEETALDEAAAWDANGDLDLGQA